MTGNIVFLAFAAAGAEGFSVGRSLTALVAFLGGAVLGGNFGLRMTAESPQRWLRKAALFEATLLLMAGLVFVGLPAEQAATVFRLYAVIVLTAIAMGFRNATVRRLAVPDLTTTVLTLTLTGLVADSSLAGGKNTRIGTRAASIVSMFLGAVAGAILLRLGTAVPLFLGGTVVLIGAIALSKDEQR